MYSAWHSVNATLEHLRVWAQAGHRWTLIIICARNMSPTVVFTASSFVVSQFPPDDVKQIVSQSWQCHGNGEGWDRRLFATAFVATSRPPFDVWDAKHNNQRRDTSRHRTNTYHRRWCPKWAHFAALIVLATAFRLRGKYKKVTTAQSCWVILCTHTILFIKINETFQAYPNILKGWEYCFHYRGIRLNLAIQQQY